MAAAALQARWKALEERMSDLQRLSALMAALSALHVRLEALEACCEAQVRAATHAAANALTRPPPWLRGRAGERKPPAGHNTQLDEREQAGTTPY